MSELLIEIPEPFQYMFIPKRYKLWRGGRGGAKSESIGRGLLMIAGMSEQQKADTGLLFPEAVRILCTREIQNSIKESVHKLLADLIDGYRLKNFRVLNDAIYNTKTGSDFLFKGLKTNIDSIKSMKGINIVWVEEAHKVSKESIVKLKPTIREPNSEIWFSYNPEFDDDPVTVEFPEPDEDTFIRHINYDENPFFPEVLEKERLRDLKLKPDDYGWIWEGKTKNGGTGTVVRNFTDENIKPVNYCPDLDLHITCDFNVDPMCWILAHKGEEVVFFFDEIVLENTTTVKCIEEFHNRYAGHQGKIIINGDASGNNRSTQSEFTNYILMRNRLSALGYRDVDIKIKGWNPPIKNRIAAWNNKVVDFNGNRGIIINPKCKWLIYNCKKLKYKVGSSIVDVPTTAQIKQNLELKFLEHPFDAASYLVDFYWPVSLDGMPVEQKTKPTTPQQYNFKHLIGE